MFDAIGHEIFGDAWTGKMEYSARAGLWTIAEYEKAKVTPGSGMRGSGGVTFAPSLDDPSSAEYQAEREARLRYEQVCADFLSKLEAGELKAAELDTWNGRIIPIGRHAWRTRPAETMLSRGIGPFRHGSLLIVTPPEEPLVGKQPQHDGAGGRRRGPKVDKRETVKAKMRKFGIEEVQKWSETAMAAEFGASRDTCRKALKELKAAESKAK
ncbi:hypothetical protein [Bradyrhizobium sp. 27S5]|uniref:hypothetical protein n=1 Tax=Bradyrhizobium sp. 27S5 TaxID=3139728 RepID=UPI0030D284FF